jgi:protein TonB
LAVLAVVAWLVWSNRKRGAAASGAPQWGTPTAETAAAPADPNQAAPQLSPVPTGSPADVQGMMEQELAKREAELRRQLDERQAQLERELAAAQAARGGPPPAAAQPTPTPAAAPTQTTERPSAPPPSSPAVEPEPSPPSQVPSPPPPEPVRAKEPEPEPEPTPTAPRVRLGDLVEMGPGVVPPQLVSAPKAQYPPMARTLKVEGVVVVSVLVDENGRVADARVAESSRQKAGLDEAAVEAAKRAQYRPATKDGVRVKMWTRLRIPFKL